MTGNFETQILQFDKGVTLHDLFSELTNRFFQKDCHMPIRDHSVQS